jgi:hypothetical protein
MGWSVLADFVLLFHAAYVGYVVLGLVAIVLGIALGWNWVRNFWFRLTHLGAIALVAAESIVGLACPLTTLENTLRQAAGQRGYAGGIARWVQPLIFFDFPPWMFMVAYTVFGLLVAVVFYFAPPLGRGAGRQKADHMAMDRR